jgi:hypothetical protein
VHQFDAAMASCKVWHRVNYGNLHRVIIGLVNYSHD